MKDMPVADLRRLEIEATPDPAFVARSLAAITVDVRDARRRDAGFLGRIRRWFGSVSEAIVPDTEALRALRIPLLVLLLLALLYATLVVVGSLLRPPAISGGNGPAVAIVDGTLSAIDMTDGTRRDLLPPGTEAAGVSRSPDGMLVTFWTEGGTRLEVMRIDGTDRRRLATAVTVKGARCFDVWSADSRELAAEVLDAGIQRILVVDVTTGDARFLTAPSLAAGCPLWSPDGRSIALTYSRRSGIRGVGIVGADGTGFHDFGGAIEGRSASGTNSWSPDGQWVYFDAPSSSGNGGLFRANVDGRFSQRLTDSNLSAYAPALSPDGTKMSFIVERAGTFDLYVARADGADPHLILSNATNEGWSTDSEFILARWAATGGGVTTVRPDGTDRRVMVPFPSMCALSDCPAKGLSWGQPRP
jgi:WD40-like Beta Propeller Repeat